MAATGYTPISLYYSTTASAVPTAGNLANGELALNTADMKLYAKNSSGVVTLLASNASTAAGVDSLSFGSTGLTPSTATTGAITVAGTLATTNGGTGRTSYTANSVLYASSTSAIASGSALTFNGSALGITGSGLMQTLSSSGDFSTTGTAYLRWYDSGGAKGYIGYAGTASTLSLASSMAGLDLQSNTYVTFSIPSEQMRLTSTGLGIGTTSPAQKLVVSNAGANGIEFDPSTGAMQVYNRSTAAYGVMNLYGNTIYFRTGASPAINATIDASGNVGIGTTSPGTKLQVTSAAPTIRIQESTTGGDKRLEMGVTSGGQAFIGANQSAQTLQFQTTGITVMTLDASGNLGVGTTSPSSYGKLAVSGNAALNTNGQLKLYNSANSNWSYIDNPSTDATAFMRFAVGTGEAARISSAGGFSVGTTADPGVGAIYATGNITAYYSSDIKFKENVRDIPDALATVNAIGGKLFDWTDEYIESKGGADGYFVQKADFGVVAQDVQKVFPIAVRTREDGSLAVDYEKLGALAFAAVGELTTLVQTLTARVEALEKN